MKKIPDKMNLKDISKRGEKNWKYLHRNRLYDKEKLHF